MTAQTDHILLAPTLYIGGTQFISADKVDVEAAFKAGTLDERTLMLLERQGQIVPVTRERFALAVARRPRGTAWPPRGFTQAYLEAAGLVDAGFDPNAPEEAPAAPAPVEKKTKSHKSTRVPVTHVKLTPEAVRVGEYFLQPSVSAGRFTFWTAADAEGRVLRPAMFKNVVDGTKFLEGINAPATPAKAATPEPAHDRDVQSRPGNGDRQDPPADR